MNILTPKMFLTRERIRQLEWLHKCDPNDYMIEFELKELTFEYSDLRAKERRKAFRIVNGCRQCTEVTHPKAV